MARSLFGNSTQTSHQSITGEIDLRAEFDNILYGFNGGPRHGHLILLRRLRRDANNIPIACSCTAGGVYKDPDPTCVYCDGEGYYWDEEWHWCYSMYSGGPVHTATKILPFGAIKTDYRTFYLRFDNPILYGDKIVEVKLDTEGNPLVPYIRRAIHNPSTIQEYRSDNGRIEYLAIHCREDNAVRPENPVSNLRH